LFYTTKSEQKNPGALGKLVKDLGHDEDSWQEQRSYVGSVNTFCANEADVTTQGRGTMPSTRMPAT